MSWGLVLKRVESHKNMGVPVLPVAAYIDTTRKEKRTVHAVGDGTFIVDRRKIDRKKMMTSKLPSGF